MSWCLSGAAALNVSAACSQGREPSTFLAPHSAWLSTSVTSPWPGTGFFGSALVSMNVSDIGLIPYCSALHPHFAVPVLPAKVVVGVFQNRGLEAVWRLEFKIKQRLRGQQAGLPLRR